jgi:hypothetical protein
VALAEAPHLAFAFVAKFLRASISSRKIEPKSKNRRMVWPQLSAVIGRLATVSI